MPSPQQPHNAARRYEAIRQQLANHLARHERVEAQAPLPPGPTPFQFIRPPSTSPFYTRPPPDASTGSTPTAATEDVGTEEPPFNPQKPVAIINGYLGTSTTYPEAWPLSYLAMTKYPGMRPRTQLGAKTDITAHVAEHVGVAPAQPQTSQPHFSQPQTPQATPRQEIPEDRPTKESEQPKPSAKCHLRPEKHRGDLYTDTGLQRTRSEEFGSQYLHDESGSGSGSLCSLPSGIGWREGRDISPSVILGSSTIISPPPNSLPPPQSHPRLHRVVHSFTPTMHDELPVRTGELVYLLKVFDDGWCMVEDVLKQEGMLPRQCISDCPFRERSVEEDDGIRVSTTALFSMTNPRTVISDHPEAERREPSDGGDDGGGGEDVQATAAALSSLSIEAEPKDQIIDLLAQLARSRKVARAQVVADMVAANEVIEARAAARAEVEAAETEKENDDGEGGSERDWEDRRQRMNGLNAMLATEANRARFNQIVGQLARQEELEQEQEIFHREAVQERLSRDEAEQERYPRETSTDASVQQEKFRREAEEERLRREAGEERICRQVEEHLLSSQMAPGGASGQQKQLRRKAEGERLRRETETQTVIREAEKERLLSATAASGSSALRKKKEKNKSKKNKQKKRGAW